MCAGYRGFHDLLGRTDLDVDELRTIPARANINNHAIHQFFCKRHGVPLERILAGTGVSPAEFLNEKLWTDPVAARLIDMNAAEAFPGFFHARTGFEEGLAFVDVMPNLHVLYFRLLPIRTVLVQLDRANAKFNNEYRLEAFRIRPGSALITLTPYPYRVARLVGQECHFIRGVLQANFSLHGIREVEITERYCSTPIRSLVEGVYRRLHLTCRETAEAILINGREVARRIVLRPHDIEGRSIYEPSRSDDPGLDRNGRETGNVTAYRVTETFRYEGHELFREGEIYGAPHCLLEVTWRGRAPFAALLDRIRAPLRMRRVTLGEMQRQIEHSNRQFFELLEQKRRTIEALQSADRQKDEFLARTAHDLRTPLNGITGLVESAGRQVRTARPDRAVRSLELALTSARGLSHLVTDIIDYTRLQDESLTLQHADVDLRSILVTTMETVAPLLNGKDVDLKLECPGDGALRIRADENRLFQVFFNLLGNAVKFTERGAITVGAHRDGDHAVVQVSDTGIGIPSEHHASIFETYEQVSPERGQTYGGAGIGLSVVRRLVELHGGSVAVESAENEGSTFTVRLPAGCPPKGSLPAGVPDAAHPPRDTPPRDAPPTAPRSVSYRHDRQPDSMTTVWVCDDDAINLEVLRSMLDDEGYAVRTFRRGEELITALGADSIRIPAVILLDVMMPGVGGLETCRLIRRQYAPSMLPVIMVTARSFPEDLQAGFDAGASDYVCKPIVREELLARTALHLSLSRAFLEQKLHHTQLRVIDTVLTLVGYTRDQNKRNGDDGRAGDGRAGDLMEIVREIGRSIEQDREPSEQRESTNLRDVLRELAEEYLRLSREVVPLPEGEGPIAPVFPVILEKVHALLNASNSNGVSVDGERLGLSPREAEVAEAVCLGYGNGEIASNLAISENTVKRHLYNAYNKLGVDSRAQLVYKILFDLS
jgi:signal transduction histidine kinase/DNA-binding NarL/FixJ family response regulator